MKPIKALLGTTILFGTLSLMTACGKSSSSSDATYETKSFSGNISLTNISSAEASGNYYLWLQNRASKQVYFVDIDALGNFALDIETTKDLENGDDFFAGIIQKNPFKYLGPITVLPNGSATEASTGFKFSGDVEGASITFDALKGRGDMATANMANLSVDTTFKTRLASAGGIPVGVGNNGKGSGSKTGSLNDKNTIDQDEDGIPDMFDAMNNGAKLDNEVENGAADLSIHSSTISGAVMFMNLKIDKSNSFTVTQDANVVLQLTSSDPTKISSMKATLVNSNYTSSKIDALPNGFTAVDTYPSTGSNWSAENYTLYKALNLSGQTIWTVLLKPNNNTFGPGQLILVEVTKTNSKKEYFWLSLNFKFQTILNDTTTWSTGSGSSTDPYQILTTGGRVFSYDAPTDESGTPLTGLTYSMELFFYDSSNQQIGDRQVIDIGTDVLTSTLTQAQIDTYSSHSPAPAYMQVDLTARYPHGDNAATKIYMKRSNW